MGLKLGGDKGVDSDGRETFGLLTWENAPRSLQGKRVVLDGNYVVIGAAVVFLGVLALALN
jgi:hypothetical protein